jgi:sensor histidine kinase YesM
MKKIFSLFGKKNLIHYAAQIIGVLLIEIPSTISWLTWWGSDQKDYIIKFMAFNTIAFIIIAIMFVHIYNLVITKNHKIILFGFTAVILISISSAAAIMITNGMKWLFWKQGLVALSWKYIFQVTANYFWESIYSTAIYLLIYFWLEYQSQTEKVLKANLLANEAQLKMLQYQINPHFLFNTITSVLSLMDENKNKAKEVLISLSEYFRYTLNNKNGDTVELSKEIEAIKKYLEIQKTRFEEKLEIKYRVDPKAEKIKTPFFIIHPLVENAVKYGIKTSPSPLTIIIEVTLANGRNLHIDVMNTGRILSENSEIKNGMSTSTGIENLKKRLKILFGEKSSFALSERDGYVHASIIISEID